MAFPTELGGSANDLLFSTKERDFSIGLDNHGFRYYDPLLGKYLTRDPSGYPDGPNNYLYVNNNPINSIDPFGLHQTETEGLESQYDSTSTNINILNTQYTNEYTEVNDRINSLTADLKTAVRQFKL